ncbi:MAG TPA: DUF6491 family protein [Caulobacterales bacterium]|nr:DUF6491 family protein [Caulobacterales bacterium]
MWSLKTCAAALLGAAALIGCASAETAAPPKFTVIEPNVAVSLREVDARSWGKDNSIILETFRREWYRAVLSGGCTHAGDLTQGIGFQTQTGDLVDRGSDAIIGGQRCHINSVDKIEAPPPGSRW